MTLAFPNPSRSFDEMRNAICFIGHDGMFQVRFFVEVEALGSFEGHGKGKETAEIAYLSAFDALRASIRTEPRAELPDAEVDPMTAEILTLHDAIDQLPTEQRQVIELKYLVGMSNAEVAAAMDTSTGAINAKQWRALKSLAEVLEERG